MFGLDGFFHEVEVSVSPGWVDVNVDDFGVAVDIDAEVGKREERLVKDWKADTAAVLEPAENDQEYIVYLARCWEVADDE